MLGQFCNTFLRFRTEFPLLYLYKTIEIDVDRHWCLGFLGRAYATLLELDSTATYSIVKISVLLYRN